MNHRVIMVPVKLWYCAKCGCMVSDIDCPHWDYESDDVIGRSEVAP
jgi:ATP sulfurylase